MSRKKSKTANKKFNKKTRWPRFSSTNFLKWTKINKIKILKCLSGIAIGAIILVLIVDTITIFNLRNEQKQLLEQEEENSQTKENESEKALDTSSSNGKENETNTENEQEENSQEVQTKEVIREIIVQENPQKNDSEPEVVNETPKLRSFLVLGNTTEEEKPSSEKIYQVIAKCAAIDNGYGIDKSLITPDNASPQIYFEKVGNSFFYNIWFYGASHTCFHNPQTEATYFIWKLDFEKTIEKELQNEQN